MWCCIVSLGYCLAVAGCASSITDLTASPDVVASGFIGKEYRVRGQLPELAVGEDIRITGLRRHRDAFHSTDELIVVATDPHGVPRRVSLLPMEGFLGGPDGFVIAEPDLLGPISTASPALSDSFGARPWGERFAIAEAVRVARGSARPPATQIVAAFRAEPDLDVRFRLLLALKPSDVPFIENELFAEYTTPLRARRDSYVIQRGLEDLLRTSPTALDRSVELSLDTLRSTDADRDRLEDLFLAVEPIPQNARLAPAFVATANRIGGKLDVCRLARFDQVVATSYIEASIRNPGVSSLRAEELIRGLDSCGDAACAAIDTLWFVQRTESNEVPLRVQAERKALELEARCDKATR